MSEGNSAPLVVIPARAHSTRFPLKVLAQIQGKPMVQYVWEAACRVAGLSDCVVATDEVGVLRAVEAFGGKAVLTPVDLSSGSDRVAYVARERESEIVVNVQGDEPLISTEAIGKLITSLRDSQVEMATLAVKGLNREALMDPNVVKVVTDRFGQALYFSRQPLSLDRSGAFLKHIGIYAFRKKALLQYCEWPKSPLEEAEGLEQLRALENGFRIKVVVVEQDTVAVDVPEDLKRVEFFLSKARSR